MNQSHQGFGVMVFYWQHGNYYALSGKSKMYTRTKAIEKAQSSGMRYRFKGT